MVTPRARAMSCRALMLGVEMPRSISLRWPIDNPVASAMALMVSRLAFLRSRISAPMVAGE